MASASIFLQQCPVCGRHLQIRIRYLGKSVTCQHCQGQFVARDEEQAGWSKRLGAPDLLQRADQLIESADELLPRSP